MTLYEVFSQSLELRYKASICSKATVFYVIATLLTFVLPLLVTYRSQGFWKKISFYREQPEVHFKHKMIVVLETSSPEQTFIWTSFPNLNKFLKNDVKMKIPVIEHMEIDNDRDGKYDKLQMKIEVPLANEEILSAKLLLFFDYKLHLYSLFQMESLLYVEYNSPLPGGSFDAIGELSLHQKEPLKHSGKDLRYYDSIIDETKYDVNGYRLKNILNEYNERNVTTRFEPVYPTWLAGRGVNEPFTISLRVLYREETIEYLVGFWQLLKWAWVQYFAVTMAFVCAFSRIKTYIFQNQLVPSFVYSPLKKDI